MQASQFFRCIAVAMLVCTAGASLAQQCIREMTTVYLDVLEVRSCLLTDGSEAVTGRGDQKGTLISGATQKLKNLSKKPIVLEIWQDFFTSYALGVQGDGRYISRPMTYPRLHDPSYVQPEMNSYQLMPGESKEMTYKIADVLIEEPRAGASYSLATKVNIPFRYLDEPRGMAFRLRQDESNAKKQYVQSHFFEGVRLK